jgi:hypothetical protein
MKKCPHYNQAYFSSEAFCRSDGAVLLAENNVTSSPFLDETPTLVTPHQVKAENTSNSNLLYFIIGILATSLLGTLLFFGLSKGNFDKTETANDKKKDELIQSKDIQSKSKSTYFPDSNTSNLSANQTNKPFIANSSAVNSNTAANVFRPNTSPTGNWSGDWSSPSGAYLKQNISLKEDGNGNVSGQIVWTLMKTNRAEKMNKIGLSGTEYVSGQYDSSSQTLSLRGYRKDDPNEILVMLDSYHLKISGSRLSGFAKNGGKWNGRMNLSR